MDTAKKMISVYLQGNIWQYLKRRHTKILFNIDFGTHSEKNKMFCNSNCSNFVIFVPILGISVVE